jgi:hypothetical protein
MIRSDESRLLNSIIAGKEGNEYSIMGDPGEGGSFFGTSPVDAFAKYEESDTGHKPTLNLIREYEKQLKEVKKDKEWQLGNYDIKLVTKSV